jgi:hypothetical protein
VFKRPEYIVAVCLGLVVSVYMLTATVHVDEGWFHHLAKAKNDNGFYTFPAFYDVPVLKGYYTHGNSLFVQFYRFLDWLFPNGAFGILVMRVLFLALFVWTLWLYLARLNVFGGPVGNMMVMAVIVLQPVVLSAISRARPELVMASLLLLLFRHFRRDDIEINWNALFILSMFLFLVHPNGVLYLMLLMLLAAETKNINKIMQLWGLGLLFVAVYYLVFVDANFPLYKEQFNVMFASGGERKFISHLGDVPLYIYSEIRDRYLLWEWRELMSYPFLLAATLVPIGMGVYAGLRHRLFKQELIYILGTMIFFLLLGNKFPGYLAYILPVLMIMGFYSIRKNKKAMAMAMLFLIVPGAGLAVQKISWNLHQQKLYHNVLEAVYHEARQGEMVYAPLRLEPFLSEQYIFRTTTQKGKNDFYRRYSISPRRCLVVERKLNEVWDYAGPLRETIFEEDDISVQRIH